MTSGPIVGPLIMFIIPLIGTSIFQILYNTVDFLFVGNFLDRTAAAAVGASATLITCTVGIFTGISVGTSVIAAQAIGAGKQKEAEDTVHTSVAFGIAGGLVIMLIGRILIEPMVYWLGATAECADYSMQYANYVLYAAPFMIGSFILNMCLRSEGSAAYSMIGIGFGGILNCFLDPLFIYTFGMGVAGAALATTISKGISLIVLLSPFFRGKTMIELKLRYFTPKAHIYKQIAKMGIPTLLRSSVMSLSAVFVNSVI